MAVCLVSTPESLVVTDNFSSATVVFACNVDTAPENAWM